MRADPDLLSARATMPENGSTLEEAMLGDCRVYTTLPVTDPARARAFYAEKLGLRPTEPDGDFYECGGGTRFVISLMGAKPGGHTQMGFMVDDIAATVKELESNGVVFENYDLPSFKTIGGIADRGDMKVAWFKDSEGNMLGIAQPVDESVRAAMGAAAARR
jgi:catechol 2,3-dioxygenase-like lactoylglutathione lyase family enzyme